MSEPVTVMLLTYGGTPERRRYAERTLGTLIGRLHYSGPLYLHIADDGSPVGHIERLAQIAETVYQRPDGRQERPFAGVTATNSERRGYGASYNRATWSVHDRGGFVLAVEDDWELTRPLDLDPLVAALKENDLVSGRRPIGCIRLGYLGFWADIRATFLHSAGSTYALLDPESPSQDVWAGHPRLESVEWQRWVGLWPEGLRPGETELVVQGRREARTGVAWPVDLVLARGDLFCHIGTEKAVAAIDEGKA